MGAEADLARRCDEATRDIEATRRRIQEKAGSVEDRLTPKALLRPVQRRLEGTLGAGGEKVLEAFRDHPLPLALTGVGLGWLLWCEMRGERPACAAEAATAWRRPACAAEAATAWRRPARAAEAATALGAKPRGSARDWFSRTLEEKPMMLAVGALAAGVLAAFVLPKMSKEEEALEKLGEMAAAAVLAEGKEPPAPAAGDDAPPAGL